MFHSPASRARRFSSSMTGGWKCGSPDSRSWRSYTVLGRVDVLVHERRQALLEFGTALARLEVHWVLSLGDRRRCGRSPRIIADEQRRRATAPPGWTTTRSTPASAWRWRRRCRPPRCSRRAAGARSTPRAASPRSCSSSAAQTLAFVVEGLGTKSIIARQVLEEQGDRPLRGCRLRHRRGDRERPLLRRRAAARGERVLRDRRLGVVPATRALGVAARGLAPVHAPTRAACGAAASRRRSRGCSPSRTSSWRAPPSGPCPTGAARSWASASRRAMRSCSSPPAGCTPTAPRSRAGSPSRLPDGYATKLRAARRSARRCWSRR